jgi:hypothetical protein
LEIAQNVASKRCESELSDFLKEQREHKATAEALPRGKMTFADALAAHQQKLCDDVQAKRNKASTEHYWKRVYAALLKSWPDLAEKRRATNHECRLCGVGAGVCSG